MSQLKGINGVNTGIPNTGSTEDTDTALDYVFLSTELNPLEYYV
jgi:hypothetical protein